MESDLHHYFYLSSSRSLMRQAELHTLLEQSRRNNTQAELSGMLLYNEGTFVQYIEGPREPLAATVERILSDPRHRGFIEISAGPVERRCFPEWSMGFRSLQDQDGGLGGFDIRTTDPADHMPDDVPALVRAMINQVYVSSRHFPD